MHSGLASSHLERRAGEYASAVAEQRQEGDGLDLACLEVFRSVKGFFLMSALKVVYPADPTSKP